MEARILNKLIAMLHIKILTGITIVALFATGCAGTKNKEPGIQSSPAKVLAIIEKVNSYWQSNYPAAQRSFWDEAAYHTGNIAAYQVTGNKTFLAYSTSWA